jgi:Domain of unknown function DUF20.
MSEKIEVTLSPNTIKTILLIAIGIIFIWQLSDFLILLITAIMVASALNPAVKWLNKKLSKTLSASIVVICLVLPLIFVLGTVIPDIINQFPDIVTKVTSILNNANFLPPFLRLIRFLSVFSK